MSDWRNEFQYLLSRKMLSRDELAFLFGQIKSIVDSSNKQLQDENKRLKEKYLQLKEQSMRQIYAIQKELEGFHNCINQMAEQGEFEETAK